MTESGSTNSRTAESYLPPPEKRPTCYLQIDQRNGLLAKWDKEGYSGVQNEIVILSSMRHPSIIQPIFCDFQNHIMVVPYMPRGDLIDLIINNGPLSEDYTKVIMTDMLNAVAYLAHQGIAHLDIKPDNILISSDNGRPILFDFGLAARVGSGRIEECGSTGYKAPEVLQGSADFAKADVWSLGVTMYVCLYGELPFGECDAPRQVEHYREFLESRLRGREYPLAHDLIRRMLAFDPNERIDASSALQHPWLQRMNQ